MKDIVLHGFNTTYLIVRNAPELLQVSVCRVNIALNGICNGGITRRNKNIFLIFIDVLNFPFFILPVSR